MTFKDFLASKQFAKDIRTINPHIWLEEDDDTEGFVYMSHSYIFMVEPAEWNNYQQFNLHLETSEYQSNDLRELELRLYNFIECEYGEE